jgi:hypothetical protein
MNFNMKTFINLCLIVLFVLFFVQYFIKNNKPISPNREKISVLSEQVTPSIISSNSNAQCHIVGVFPDQNCTPGAIDPNVTQENIHETICVSGYTKGVRPPVSYTNHLKIQQIAEYGYADTNPHDYEEDHLISLELGGAPSDPKNLWPEPGRSPNPKDDIENLCHKKICDGEITLAEAQKQISINWQIACQ